MHDTFALVSYPFYTALDVLLEYIYAPLHRTRRQQFARSKVVLHVLKYPWATKSSTTYHDGIYAEFIETILSLFRGSNITISNDRYVYARIILHLTNKRPVGITTVHLAACSTVNSQFGYTAILQRFRYRGDNAIVIIPSEASFHSNRCIDRFHHCSGNIQHLRDIFQQSRTRTFSRHFLDWTTEIYIDEIGLSLLYDACSICHTLGFATIDLDGYRAFLVGYLEFACGGCHITHQGVRIHKLGIYTCSTKTLAKQAKSRIGDILHWCEV